MDRPKSNGADPNSTHSAGLMHLSRDGITPSEEHRKLSAAWEIEVTLLPSSRWNSCPEEGSDHYLRLLTRGLIRNQVIQGHDSTSINDSISALFTKVLNGREWTPLQALRNTITSDICLLPLTRLQCMQDRDFNFLADTCFIQTEDDDVLHLFIAPSNDHLSWEFIRGLPKLGRPRLRGGRRQISEEEFWESDDQDTLHYYDLGSPSTLERTATTPSSGTLGAETIKPVLPNNDTIIVEVTKNNKGKYPCPFSECLRARVPFAQKEVLLEHLKGRHKATAFEESTKSGDNADLALSIETIAQKPKLEATSPDIQLPKVFPAQLLQSSSTQDNNLPGTQWHASDELPLNSSSQALNEEHQDESGLNLISNRVRRGIADSTDSIARGKNKLESTHDDDPIKLLHSRLAIRSHADNGSTSGTGNNHAPNSDSNSNSNSNSSGGGVNNTNKRGSASGKRQFQGKRQRTDDTEDRQSSDEGESDGDEPKRTGTGQGSEEERSKKFACPFSKHSPNKYPRCDRKAFPSFHRAKEHVLRMHELPKHQCRRCMTRFKKQEELDDHVRVTVQCPLMAQETDTPEGVTPEQIAKLKHRKPKVPEQERWIEMYMILFPSDTHGSPPSPWCDEPFDADSFRRFLSGPMSEPIKQRCLTYLVQFQRLKGDGDDFINQGVSLIQKLSLELLNYHQLRSPDLLPRTNGEPDNNATSQEVTELAQETALEPAMPTPVVESDATALDQDHSTDWPYQMISENGLAAPMSQDGYCTPRAFIHDSNIGQPSSSGFFVDSNWSLGSAGAHWDSISDFGLPQPDFKSTEGPEQTDT